MTAQVLAANLGGVAMASDTLVTLGGGGGFRTFAGYSKIFSLGASHKVAIMFSGNANVNGFPARTLLENWASELPNALASVSDYARSFLDWVDEKQRSSGFLDEIRLESQLLNQEFNGWLEILDLAIEEHGDQAETFLAEYVQKLNDLEDEKSDNYSGLTKEIALERVQIYHQDLVEAFFQEVEEVLTIDAETKNQILENCSHVLYSLNVGSEEDAGATTFAFAGYGFGQMTPEIVRFSTLGFFMGRLRTYPFNDSLYGSDEFYLNEDGTEDDFAYFPLQQPEECLLFSFAQDSTIKGFVGGISPEFTKQYIGRMVRDGIRQSLWGLGKGISDSDAYLESARVSIDIEEVLNEKVREKWKIFLDSVSSLTLSSLGSLSESLVRIQSLAKYTNENLTTVGDEIEVFTIDKLEGVQKVI
jgi:hypothetical protein